MKPAEVAVAYQQFAQEIANLKGDALLDKWIAFEGSPDSREPDLGIQKGQCLEAALIKEFGLGKWRDAVQARRKATDAQRS